MPPEKPIQSQMDKLIEPKEKPVKMQMDKLMTPKEKPINKKTVEPILEDEASYSDTLSWRDNSNIKKIIKDEPIIEKIIETESSGNPNAVNKKQEQQD